MKYYISSVRLRFKLQQCVWTITLFSCPCLIFLLIFISIIKRSLYIYPLFYWNEGSCNNNCRLQVHAAIRVPITTSIPNKSMRWMYIICLVGLSSLRPQTRRPLGSASMSCLLCLSQVVVSDTGVRQNRPDMLAHPSSPCSGCGERSELSGMMVFI